MAGVKTGKWGYVNGIPCVSTWGYATVAELEQYAASCTDFGHGQTVGVVNESGVITGIGGNPPITPGVPFVFKGISDNTPGAAEAYDGTIMPLSLNITANKENGGNLSWSVNFGVQGRLVPGSVGAADANFTLQTGAAIVADALINGAPDYPIPGFRAWELNVSCAEKLYTVNGERHRLAGNLECTVGIDVFNSELRNVKYDPNVVAAVQLFVDATTFWKVEWLRFRENTGYTVDRATQAIQGYRINGAWTAVNAAALGHITRPGGAHLFGV